MASPKVPDELQRFLTRAVEARDELRATIAEAHSARKDLLATFKEQVDAIRHLIEDEVRDGVAEVTDAARTEMRARAGRVIDELEADWRGRLGL